MQMQAKESMPAGVVFNEDNIGENNPNDIVCKDCGLPILTKGIAKKIKSFIYFLYDHEREFEPLLDYWAVNKLSDFNNIQICARNGNVEFISCIRCSTRVIGAIIKTTDDCKIYVSCQRTCLGDE